MFYPQYQVEGEIWENQWGKLEVYPDVATEIIRQVQYCNFTSYIDDTEIDVAFRFDFPLTYKDIWIWRNISHDVRVSDYGNISGNYILYNISDIQIISEPEYVDFGCIPSNYYRRGNASFWMEIEEEWYNGTFNIAFDSFQWLNPEYTKARFNYTFLGITSYHIEQQYWFDWDSIKDKFNYIENNGSHYYYVRDFLLKDKLYRFKWEYDVSLGSNGKWDLLAKKSNDPIGNWRVELDPWWNSNWNNFKICHISNKRDDYQIMLNVGNSSGGNVTCNGNIGQSDFKDIRFINLANTTEYYHWQKNFTSDKYSVFWVNNSDNASSILMYYNNPSCGNSTFKDGNETFDCFDEFNQAFDNNKWDTIQGAITTNDKKLELIGIAAPRGLIESVKEYTQGRELQINARWRADSLNGIHYCAMRTSGDWNNRTEIHTSNAADYDMDLRTEKDDIQTLTDNTNNNQWGNPLLYNTYTIQWYKHSNNSDMVVYRANGIINTHWNNVPTYNQEVVFYESLTVDDDMYIDWVFLRKFCAVNPSWSSFGNEQTYPAAANNNPTVSAPYPEDGGENIPINFTRSSITVNDPDGHTMNITWTTNSTSNGAWVVFNTSTNVANGTHYGYNTSWADTSTDKYWWNVSVNDGKGGWVNNTYNFTTGENGTSDYIIVDRGFGMGMMILFSFSIAIVFIAIFYRRQRRYRR